MKIKQTTNQQLYNHVVRFKKKFSDLDWRIVIIFLNNYYFSFLDGKHPVSSLLEVCRARRWQEPVYDMVSETGPDHLKSFLMKVKVNNVVYQPDAPSQNKKLAKASAAMHCLKVLGLVNSWKIEKIYYHLLI